MKNYEYTVLVEVSSIAKAILSNIKYTIEMASDRGVDLEVKFCNEGKVMEWNAFSNSIQCTIQRNGMVVGLVILLHLSSFQQICSMHKHRMLYLFAYSQRWMAHSIQVNLLNMLVLLIIAGFSYDCDVLFPQLV